jgi:hypothetical protein
VELRGVRDIGLAGKVKISKQAVLFLKKKNQKNFCSFRAGSFELLWPKTNKSFFGSFFSKKEALS